MFNIIWSYLISWLLPWFLNKPKHNDWLNAILKPTKVLYADFLSFRDQTMYDLSITGQVISLEMMLNDIFNGGLNAWNFNSSTFTYDPNTPNAIYITDNPNRLIPPVLWTRAELNAPFGRPPLILYTRSEVNAHPALAVVLYSRTEYNQQPDFVVYVPTALANVTTDLAFVARMKGWINTYKQAGARYAIVNY